MIDSRFSTTICKKCDEKLGSNDDCFECLKHMRERDDYRAEILLGEDE